MKILYGLLSVAAGLVIASAQGKSADVWQGTTSQGRALSFTIANGTVTKVSLDWILPLARTCAAPGSTVGITQSGGQNSLFFYPDRPGNEPPQVTDRAFRLTGALSGPPASVKMVLTGRFISQNEASGSLALSSEECKAGTTLTWKAARQAGTPAAAKGLTIGSAKRTKEFLSGGQSLRANAPAEDVVLVLTLTGISVEEFQKVDREAIYVMAGDLKRPPSMSSSGIVNDKPIIQLAIVVPRSSLEMQLFVGAYPPVAFKAPMAVTESER